MTDQNLEKIKKAVYTILPESEIILFGSRAREEFRDDSDYDIMVVVPFEIDVKEKMKLNSKMRKLLAKNKIDVDVTIQSQKELEIKKDLLGHVASYAMKEGVKI